MHQFNSDLTYFHKGLKYRSGSKGSLLHQVAGKHGYQRWTAESRTVMPHCLLTRASDPAFESKP